MADWKFNYVRRSSEDVQKRMDDRSRGRGFSSTVNTFSMYRPRQGMNHVRILPQTWSPTDKHYAYEVWEHRWVGVENSNYLCLQKMKHKRCPMCEEAAALKRAARTQEQMSDAVKYEAKQRWYMFVLDRNQDADNPNEPMVWAIDWRADNSIGALTKDYRTGKVIWVDDPEQGYDLTFQRQGQGIKTQYTGYVFDREPTPIAAKQSERNAILKKIEATPIPSILAYQTAEHMEQMLTGTAVERDADLDDAEPVEDEEEEEAPRKRAKAAADDDDDTTPDDDEEAEKEDDEEDDEDNGEEEEESEAEDEEEEREEAEEEEEEEEDDDDEPEVRPTRKPLREPEPLRTKAAKRDNGGERLRHRPVERNERKLRPAGRGERPTRFRE